MNFSQTKIQNIFGGFNRRFNERYFCGLNLLNLVENRTVCGSSLDSANELLIGERIVGSILGGGNMAYCVLIETNRPI